MQRQYNLNNRVRNNGSGHGHRMEPPRSNGQPYPPFPDSNLPGFPAAYISTRNRRTQATDIDPEGRRLGDLPAERDHNGELGAKDVLPAYANFGGPSKYNEVEESRNQGPPSRRTAQRQPDGDGSNNRNNPTLVASRHTSTS